jgi:hypothetical protein
MSSTPDKPAQPQIDRILAYSIDQFCRASSLGRSFVYEQIAAGTLRTVKRGKRRLILAEDARSFMRGEPAADAA